METWLPKDWRSAVAVAVLTFLALGGLRAWMVGIAQAQVESTAEQVVRMTKKVDALYLACVAGGECKPPEVLP